MSDDLSRELIRTRKRDLTSSSPQESGSLILGAGTGPSSLSPLQGLDQRLLPTGFEQWRSELDYLSGVKLLDALTEPINAAACIQTLPVEDLHRYLYEVGLEDAESVLALASGEQVRVLLDIEVWDRSDLLPKRLDAWLFALLRAGKDVLYKRVLDLDDSLLAWVIKTNAYAFVIEDPDDFDPPDAEHFLTPDRRLCVVFPRSVDHLIDLEVSDLGQDSERELTAAMDPNDPMGGRVKAQAAPLEGGAKDLPARIFIDMLMQERPELCIHLLLASTAALSTQLNEDAYRWRAARMSDLGFIDYYEAREIYTPPPHDWRRTLPPERIDEQRPPAKTWLAKIVATDLRLDRAFAALSWDDALIVAEQLGYVANMTLSADRIPLWDRALQGQTLQRLQAGLTIALEILNGAEARPNIDADTLAKHHLNHLFRLGYEQMINAARPVWRVERALRRGDDPVGALEGLPHLKTWADGLLGDHPEGRGESGVVTPLRSLSDCKVASEGALIIEDLVQVARPLYSAILGEVIKADSAESLAYRGRVSIGPLLISAYFLQVVSGDKDSSPRPLTDDEVFSLHRRCFVSSSEMSEDQEEGVSLYAPLHEHVKREIMMWWTERGGQTKTAPLAILRELREQMAGVHPNDIDRRFIPLIWDES